LPLDVCLLVFILLPHHEFGRIDVWFMALAVSS